MKKIVLAFLFGVIILFPDFLFGHEYAVHYFGQAEGLKYTQSRNIEADWQGVAIENGTRIYYGLIPWLKEWNELPENHELTQNYPPPGDYRLQVAFAPLLTAYEMSSGAGYFLHEHGWLYFLIFIVFLAIATYLIYVFFYRRIARKKIDQLKKNEDFRHKLMAYIAHEFKTPLTIITGVSEKMEYADTKEEWRESADDLRRQSKHMNELVEQMMEWNELDAGSWKQELITADIPVEIERICAQMQSLAESLEIGLTFSSSVQSSFQITDVSRLRSVMNNLITNALKFSPEKGTVSIYFDTTGEDWSVSVRDQGSGIKAGDKTHIFELLDKGREFLEKHMSYSGVSLAYVETAVEALGGRTEVYNEGGTVFKIIFPVEEIVGQPDNDLSQPFVTGEADEGKNKGRQVSILLVEDSEEVGYYVQLCFDLKKFKIAWKKDGLEGLKYALEEIPDLVISDIRMPEMDGFELIQRLKENELTNHIPTIILTALAGEENRIKGLESGANAYVVKPFRKRELVLTVDNILSTIEKQKDLLARALIGLDSGLEKDQGEKENIPSAFIQKVNRCLEENYADSEFNTIEMADKLGMSRVQLNRKLNSIAGLNPSDMLRKYRLNQATRKLSDKGLNISEIAYDCGFSDPSYFSKLFTKEFGQSPAAYQKNID